MNPVSTDGPPLPRWERIARKLKHKGFARSVGILVGGTAFGQAIMVLVMPVLTRLYTPQDFSLLAVYVSILGLVTTAACLRLEIAIPIPERDEDAANLLILALGSVACVSMLVALAVGWVPAEIVRLVKQPALRPYLWLVPLGILFGGVYTALQFWATRKKAFSVIARTRVTQAIGGAGVQVGFGAMAHAPFGLLLGQMISNGAGVIGLGNKIVRDDRAAFRAVSWSEMWRLLRLYDRFPKYSTFESLANSAAIQLPVLMIAALATGPEAGFLMLGMRAMQAPMGLIGTAVSQVYLSHAPQEYRAGNLGRFTAGILGGLMRTGVGPIICAGIVAPMVFPLVFGERWHRAGDLVAWMTPWFVLQFLASPVSLTLHVTNSQRVALVLQIFGLALRVGAVWIAARLMPNYIAEIYAVTGAVFYLVYLVVVARLARISLSNLLGEIKRGFGIVVVWALIGMGTKLAL